MVLDRLASREQHVELFERYGPLLTAHQREVLTLYFLRELSLEEMSVLLDVPVGTVKSRLHYARQAIRQILSQGDDHARQRRGISPAAS